MDANQNLTAEMIKIDPYNYTLSEMVDVRDGGCNWGNRSKKAV